jgi:type VI protein secretion system component VasK
MSKDAGPFTPEIDALSALVASKHPGKKPPYQMPWYLVVGDPGSGRSTAVRAQFLTWSSGDGPLPPATSTPFCTYWMADEAVFIEPESYVMGPRRDPALLEALCDELIRKRPREPLDGILLVLNAAAFADADEPNVQAYARAMREMLVEIGRHLGVDVPTYIVMTRFDTMWGFADVFQWTAERKREDPWGFTLPQETLPQESLPKIREEIDGLMARFEMFCFAKLAGEEPVDTRIRAYQHLVEVREFLDRLRVLFSTLAMPNAYERVPWLRAMAIGSAVPGVGDRQRAGVARFQSMGLYPASMPQGMRGGGLPLHALVKTVVIPEKDLVPLRVRWRDDIPLLIIAGVAALVWIVAIVLAIVMK